MFLTGFLWAARGGAGIVLAAFLDREELTKLFIPLTAVFASWYLLDVLVSTLRMWNGASPPFLSTEAATATLTVAVVLLLRAVRPGIWGAGSSLILHMAAGWWAGYGLLSLVLQLHMSPPRADGWTGCAGLVAGILVFCRRYSLGGVAFAALVTGFLGGIGFVLGQMFKLLGISTGLQTNWHSVMEQTQGFFHGLALAVPFAMLALRTPKLSDDPPVRRWTEAFCVAFVLWLLTYLNFRLSPNEWLLK